MRRSVSSVLILALLTATACGNLAVPPPFDQAERGWDIERGRHVVIATTTGEEIRGEVEAVDEKGFVVDGKRVERKDIGEMWMETESPVGPVFRVALFGVIVIGGLVLMMKIAFASITLDPG
jgi:small nuclear ribonucleoprotein (snRNP)-like protein